MTKITNKHEVVLNFIEQFRAFGDAIEDCFSNGMCWHFTMILRGRFGMENMVMYDPVANHFATKIGDHIYDITGDITDNPAYKFEYWASYWLNDLKETARIRRDCIWKIPHDLLTCGICPYGYEDDFGNLICDIDNSPVDWDDPCKCGYHPLEVAQ